MWRYRIQNESWLGLQHGLSLCSCETGKAAPPCPEQLWCLESALGSKAVARDDVAGWHSLKLGVPHDHQAKSPPSPLDRSKIVARRTRLKLREIRAIRHLHDPVG